MGNRLIPAVPLQSRKTALEQPKHEYGIRHDIDRFQTPLK